MSAVKQTTVTPASVSQRVTVQLSSPPDAAKATVFPFSSCTVRLTVGSGFSVGFALGWSNIYGHRPTLHTARFEEPTLDEWDSLGPGMKIDRRATDWGLASLGIGVAFLI